MATPTNTSNETITGTDAADTIAIGADSTNIEAGGGANTIAAGSGDNVITAGSGADTIAVGDGSNEIVAGDGANTVTAGSGNNNVSAGSGADTITVGNGVNSIEAGSGANTITAGSGTNTITANGGGANTITAGSGNNTITGGSGIDTITVGNGDNIIDGGSAGANTITAGSGSNIITGGSGIDTITAMSGIDSNNIIDAGDGANTVTTGDGKDYITTGSGIDTVTSGAGDDEITVTGGSDTVTAGLGNDRLNIDLSEINTDMDSGLLAGAGSYAGKFGDGSANIITYASVEEFSITTGSGDDKITTGDGQDVLDGGAGSDILLAGDGKDTLIYNVSQNAGASDQYNGGNGIDTLTIELTSTQYLSQKFDNDLTELTTYLTAQSNPESTSSDPFEFTAFDLTLTNIETVKLIVDGVEINHEEVEGVEVLLDFEGYTNLRDYEGFSIEGAYVGRAAPGRGRPNSDNEDQGLQAVHLDSWSESTVITHNDSNFDLESFDARTGGWRANESLLVRGYENDELVIKQNINLTNTYQTFDFGSEWSDLDMVTFNNDDYYYTDIVVDNMLFTVDPAQVKITPIQNDVVLDFEGHFQDLADYKGYSIAGAYLTWGGDGSSQIYYHSSWDTVITDNDGQNFDLESLAIRSYEYWNNDNDEETATLKGYKNDELVTEQNINLKNTYQTFDFGSEWSDLDMVTFDADSYYTFVDNLNLKQGNSDDGYRYLGTVANDIIVGSESDDILMGMEGNDILTGGLGADTFVFNPEGGDDIITDFSSGDDVIDLSAFSGMGYDSLANVISHSTQKDDDVNIDLGNGDSVTLLGVDLNSLHTDDFLFV
jgi:Ca2+-binding RTX toxin-like protein